MRKISVLFMVLILLLVVACDEPAGDTKRIEHLDLNTYLESVEVPKNLSITFDSTKVSTVTSAKKYTATFLELDPDTVAKELLRNDITEQKPMAEGPYFIAKSSSMDEYLTVLDGGRSFGVKGATNGGLSYMVIKEGDQNKPELIANTIGPPNTTEQFFRSMRRSDYSSSANLSFASYAEALASVEHLLSSIGLSKSKLVESYAMDLKTMKEHYNYYLEEMMNEEEVKSYDFTAEDESYRFYFRQQIDELPVNSTIWFLGKGTAEGAAGNVMSNNPILTVTYQKDGVSNISARHFFDIPNAKSGEPESLISAVDAMKILLKEYKDLILEEGTKVSSAELIYVSVPVKGKEEETIFDLIPAWVFTITKPQYANDKGIGNYQSDDYGQYVVNAITGDKLSGMR